MLRRKTLFVVGAGASHEFGLPLGSELANNIATDLKFDIDHFGRLQGGSNELRHALQRQSLAQNENGSEFGQACRRICDAIPHHNSIDNLIDNHSHDERVAFCGKLAIAHQILSGERRCSLYVDPSNIYNEIAFNRLEETWLPALFKMMQDGVSRTSVERFFDNAHFIIFNYDRCVEHYFVRALQRAYSLSETVAARIVSAADIQHVYGSVGVLPWQSNKSGPIVPFGDTSFDLQTASTSLCTYSDRLVDANTPTLRNMVKDSDAIVFLGFGYLRTNLQILKPQTEIEPSLMMGSTLGMSQFAASQVCDTLRDWYGKLASVENLVLPHNATARSLLKDYGRALV